ncbi:MAG: lamin tail domain-containing protein [Verrucomicrobiales bacterium]|nr:lamin tail domain-containing protein [Verrucomicrobiales bacterium]
MSRACFRNGLLALGLGSQMMATAQSLRPLTSEWRWLKGTAEASPADPAAWRQQDFPDATWPLGEAPFWYGETQSSPGTELSDMRGGYTCVFLRGAFEVELPGDVQSLTLGAQSDDGFVAWINGVEVARFNMPDGEPTAGGTARPALAEPIPFQVFELDNARDYLVPGANVLAVQAFNASISGSSDFVIDVSLDATLDISAPRVESLIPPAGALVRSLRSVEVVFTEPVAGVDAADLLVNGQPAVRLVAYTERQYGFEFAEPGAGEVTFVWAAGHGITDRSGTPHPFAGGEWTCTLDPNAPPPGVRISEFMADNNDTLNDEDGDQPDWIELHNPTDEPIDLGGWHLTDDPVALTRWRLPAFTLAPGGYRVVFASGKNRVAPAGPLHTDFKLASDGGYLALTDRDGGIVSEFRYYPAQREDVSYGRDRFNATVTGYFVEPTPGRANASSGAGFSPPVEFSRPGGTFTAGFALSLAADDPQARIHYTLDGSVPDEDSPLYATPISVTSGMRVRARAFVTGLLPGDVRSEGFVALEPGVVNFSSDLPLAVLHNFGAGTVPANVDQPAWLLVFEPTADGRSSLTNAPDFASRVGINIRGSSTQGYAKSSYAVETWGEANDDFDRPLLGMPSESDWVFYAPNYFEPILIHNPFAHALSRQIGRYSPRTRFVELYVNTRGTAVRPADYMGVYVIEEKIKRAPGRVDIDRLEPEHTQPPQVTGGYLMKIDRADADERTFSAAGQGIVYQDPPGPEIQLPGRDAQEQYLISYMNAFGQALNSAGFTDPVTGYRAYVDVPSWIDHHLLNVLTFNVDALRLSTYFYKPRSGKLEFGPLWDFDRALGSTDGRDSNPRVWRATSGDRGTDFFNYPWWGRMFQDPDFWQAYVDRYQALRQAEFALTNLFALVDRLTGELREAQPREIARWSNHRPRGGSYDSEIALQKTWLSNRVDFMDGNFLDRPTFSTPPGPVVARSRVVITPATKAGTVLYYTLDGSDPRLSGGGISPTAQVGNGATVVTIERNVRITARSYNRTHANLTGANNPPISTPWSGANTGSYIIQTPPVVVSALMYHPAATPNDGPYDPEDFEYVELTNVGETGINLLGFRLSGAVAAEITVDAVLAPGGRAVLVANSAAFEARYGTGVTVAGVFSGRLDNAGERLLLEGPLHEPVQDFRYDDAWHPITDGHGFPLVAVDLLAPAAEWSLPEQWQAGGPYLGSPGAPATPLPGLPDVRINEVLAHTDPPEVDSIELLNASGAPADLSGWWLTDDFGTPDKFGIPAGTVLPPGGFVVFTEADFGSGPRGFALSSTGDEVCLFSADASGQPTGFVRRFAFGASANGVSLGRQRSSQGEETLAAEWSPSLGEPNWGPRIGPVVISEVMYQPAPVFGSENNARDEYVELCNITTASQSLYDPAHPANTWHLRGGVDFDMPTRVVLPPGGRLLIVGFDPNLRPVDLNAFRAVYGLTADVPVMGPFQGHLANEGDTVRLLRPDPPQTLPGPDFGAVPYVLVDEVDYRPVAPWPAAANGTGHSIQRSPETAYGNEPWFWHAAAPTPGEVNAPNDADADEDGLSDPWERAFGLDPTIADGEDGPEGDVDHDGLRNRDEHDAGTDPRDAASGLRIEAVQVVGGEVRIRFRAAWQHPYRLQSRAGLSTGNWTQEAAAPSGDPRWVELTVPAPAPGTERYYRLVTP